MEPAIDNIQYDFQLSIWPNPSADEMNIEFTTNYELPLSLTVTDVKGAVVANRSSFLGSNNTGYYWSSTEYNNSQVYAIWAPYGGVLPSTVRVYDKGTINWLRLIRKF